MPPQTLRLLLGASLVVWLLGCLWLYRRRRTAAWLAGSTVATGMCFLGATVATSVLVEGALLLAPLWLGVCVLFGCHLAAAQRASVQGEPSRPLTPRRPAASTASAPPADGAQGAYI